MQGLSIQDAEIEESHRRLFGEMTPATLQAIQNKYEELYIEDLLEAAVRAGLLTRTVAEDGRNYSCRPTTITFASSPPVGSCQLRSADGLGLL